MRKVGEGAPEAMKVAAAQRSAALALWRGDIGGALKTVLVADALTADFVSMAASAGAHGQCAYSPSHIFAEEK